MSELSVGVLNQAFLWWKFETGNYFKWFYNTFDYNFVLIDTTRILGMGNFGTVYKSNTKWVAAAVKKLHGHRP